MEANILVLTLGEREGELARAPVARSLIMAFVGLVAFVWAAVSLVKG